MKSMIAIFLVSMILFFLSFGNALNYRYSESSIRSFRLRRREYLTQMLKQVAQTTHWIKQQKSSFKNQGQNSFKQEIKPQHFPIPAWFLQMITATSASPIHLSLLLGWLSQMSCQPLLRPPIA